MLFLFFLTLNRKLTVVRLFLFQEMVASLDESLGRVVSALGYKGMLKNTIILFLTDNGAPSIGKYRNWGSNYPLRGVSIALYS